MHRRYDAGVTHGRLVCVLVLSWSLVSCDGDTPVEDAGPPPPTTCETPPDPLALGDDGHSEPLGAAAGEVRAGRVTAAQLPEDPSGLAVYADGDFVIANDRFALLIEDEQPSNGYDPFGGRPVGVAAVEGGALADAGDFNELLFGLGTTLVQTETVTVLADGSDGEAAVIRAQGPMGPLEFIGSLGDVIRSGDVVGLPAAVDYRLEPGSDVVEISIVVQAPTPDSTLVPLVIAASFQAYRMPLWTAEQGFGDPPTTSIAGALYVDDGRTSYALLGADGESILPVLDQAGTLIYDLGRARVAGCSDNRIPVANIVLGGPGLSGLQRSLANARGEGSRTITGSATYANGDPAPTARLHLRGADDVHFARAMVTDDGAYAIEAPMEDVSLFAVVPGLPMVGPIAVAAGESAVDVVIPDTGTVDVAITSDDGMTPMPGRVQLVPVDGAPSYPRDLGERRLVSGRSHIEFAVTGQASLRAAPGDYDVVVTRGFEHEAYTERVTVTAGATVTVAAALAHVVDSTGVMCADYHIHTHRSPDSPDSGSRKLMSLVSDGLEIAIRSDHEWVNDFEPVIAELGLGEFVRGIGGEELTTFAWGHFGVFPLQASTSARSGGAIPWAGQLPPAVFQTVRERPEQPALIINHPRSGGALGGYFSAAGFDRETGMVGRPDHWDEAFTIVEVFNDDSFDDVRDAEVADWFALLESGRRIYAVGSSDSHRLDSSPVGWPRTCLQLGTDDPRAVTPEQVRDATSAGHSVISGGILLDVLGPGGERPGDSIGGGASGTSLDVTVQAPSWVDGDFTLEVIVDGMTTESIPILETDRDPMNPAVRLRETVSVPAGSWVVLHVSSTGDLAPLHPGRSAFAVSNPIFLE